MDNKSHSGLGVLGVLQIIFIVLKCVGVVTWSWATVLIPLWLELGVLAVALFVLWVHSWSD